MPVNSTHPDYDASTLNWSRARDVLSGEDAVKAAGAKYLPRLDGQSDEDYEAYKTRACFSNATRRTADAFVGLVFRKAPFVKLPEDGGQRSEVRNGSTSPKPLPGAERVTRRPASGIAKAMQVFVNDADMLGTSLFGYAKNVVREVISVGRSGTLVDWEGDYEQRAYATAYRAEDILNWRVGRVNGRNVPTLIALRESITDARGLQPPLPLPPLLRRWRRGGLNFLALVTRGGARASLTPGYLPPALLASQTRINRLAFHCEDAKNSFMNAAQRFFADKAFERFHAECEFAQRQRAFC
jgi:hypothetical protein